MKHIAFGFLAVALLLGAVEVGLRVQHSYQVQADAEQLTLSQLSIPSWKVHHTLKPLKATIRRNPDTNLPVTIRTNSLGLRGDTISVPKPRDVFRIVYLGDDTVFAPEVAEEETFCALIQKRLAKRQDLRIEVVNAGIPDYCPLLSYLQFKHSLASLQPDLLVLNFDMSDVADDHYYRRHAQMGVEGLPYLCTHPSFQPPSHDRSASPTQKFLLLQTLKRQLGFLPADENRPSDENDIETLTGRYAWTREDRPDWEVYIAQSLSPIPHLRDLANQLSCPLVVTFSPVPWQISKKAMPDLKARRRWGVAANEVYDPKWAIQPVSIYLNALAVPYCDVLPQFRAENHPESLFLETVPRLSRRGHQVFASIVADYLTRTILPRSASPLASPGASRKR